METLVHGTVGDLLTFGAVAVAIGIVLTIGGQLILFDVRARRVGGIRFARVGRFCFSFCVARARV